LPHSWSWTHLPCRGALRASLCLESRECADTTLGMSALTTTAVYQHPRLAIVNVELLRGHASNARQVPSLWFVSLLSPGQRYDGPGR
jgi:hypothetical protein